MPEAQAATWTLISCSKHAAGISYFSGFRAEEFGKAQEEGERGPSPLSDHARYSYPLTSSLDAGVLDKMPSI